MEETDEKMDYKRKSVWVTFDTKIIAKISNAKFLQKRKVDESCNPFQERRSEREENYGFSY